MHRCDHHVTPTWDGGRLCEQCDQVMELKWVPSLRTPPVSMRENLKAGRFPHGMEPLHMYTCDHCYFPAVATPTNTEECHFLCGHHYMVYLAEQRITRPSRDELMHRIDSAIREGVGE